MSKMHYFSNKFSKIALNQFWWPEVPWFDQIVCFQADYDEIELQKKLWHRYFSDVITITSPKYVTKICH